MEATIMIKINSTEYQNRVDQPIREVFVDKFPDTCPICNYSLQVEPKMANKHDEHLQIIFCCPRVQCGCFFIAIYDLQGKYGYFSFCSPQLHETHTFSDEIETLSQNFVEIYNQSAEAESSQLFQVAGVGYRKALEFLIKDFLIDYLKFDRETISKKYLGNCIADHIDNANIKEVAKRAVWIGNDETHYVRRWENKDINDLKSLIQTTVYWISHLILTEKIVRDMT
jgi:hypothetical protein